MPTETRAEPVMTRAERKEFVRQKLEGLAERQRQRVLKRAPLLVNMREYGRLYRAIGKPGDA